jgi:hypothetical protein
MVEPRRLLFQATLYALFFVPLVFITQQPAHTTLEPGLAEFKLAIRHAGKIVGECVPLSAGNYEQLPSNMNRPETCPRERSPLELELIMDGDVLYRETVSASGLHSDGVASMYRRFSIPAGSHRLQLLMNDDIAIDGPTWQLERDIELQAAQVMVATFKDGFELQ